jgi:ubiquinone/menaquinone biosynthesis C-methylase UbiE
MSVLDSGCGAGLETVRLSRLVAPSGKVTGLDASQAFLAEARKRAGDLRLPIEYRQGDARRLPFADHSLDVACAERLLLYLQEPATALARVEKAEGRKVAHLTDEGDTYVREHREKLGTPWESAAEDYGEDLLELRNLVGQVATATMQAAQAGDSGQISEARRLLTEVRRQLYRVLAGDDTTSA